MEIKEVQMTASVWVEITKEDLDIIWACALNHYDGKVQQMVKRGGLLYGIRNHFTWPDVEANKVKVCLDFDDLDTMAKALEMAAYFLSAEDSWIAKGVHLGDKIHKMLKFINSQGSLRPVEHKVEYEVTK